MIFSNPPSDWDTEWYGWARSATGAEAFNRIRPGNASAIQNDVGPTWQFEALAKPAVSTLWIIK
jgi:hypothetical protein